MIEIPNYNDFSSVRFITILTPDTFMKKMIVVSTIFNNSPLGQTAIAHVNGLNSGDIDLRELNFKIIKTHKDFEKAKEFHVKTAEAMKWGDLQEVLKGDFQ